MTKSQRVPVVTDADVERIARRDYGEHADAVLTILSAYGVEAWEPEVPRVRAAVLRLGAGNVRTLTAHLKAAKQDYRDVLLGAEYLAYGALTLQTPTPADADAARAIDADWTDYKTWFERA